MAVNTQELRVHSFGYWLLCKQYNEKYIIKSYMPLNCDDSSSKHKVQLA